MKTFNIKYERKNGAIGNIDIQAYTAESAKNKVIQLPDVKKVLHAQIEL